MTAFFATARDLAVGLTWLWAFIALLAFACGVVTVVARVITHPNEWGKRA